MYNDHQPIPFGQSEEDADEARFFAAEEQRREREDDERAYAAKDLRDSYERAAAIGAPRQGQRVRTNGATEKQVAFLKKLSKERDWSSLRGTVNEDSIEAANQGWFVDKKEASQAIDALLRIRPPQRTVPTKTATSPSGIPAGRYALIEVDGIVRFYSVRHGKAGGRWEGYTFVNGLIGNPGSYIETRLSKATRELVLSKVGADIQAAAKLFGQKTKHCTFCDSELSDIRSRAAGWGEKCASNHSLPYPSLREAQELLGETGTK